MSATTSLLAELRHADHIIKIMLNAMTVQQKARVAEKLEAAGVTGEGMTRHHERATVMMAATKALSNISMKGANRYLRATAYEVEVLSQIKELLGDIEAQALAAKALCEIMYDELDSIEGQGIVNAAVRIDALVKATHRNAVLIKESVDAAGLVLLDAEGGAQ